MLREFTTNDTRANFRLPAFEDPAAYGNDTPPRKSDSAEAKIRLTAPRNNPETLGIDPSIEKSQSAERDEKELDVDNMSSKASEKESMTSFFEDHSGNVSTDKSDVTLRISPSRSASPRLVHFPLRRPEYIALIDDGHIASPSRATDKMGLDDATVRGNINAKLMATVYEEEQGEKNKRNVGSPYREAYDLESGSKVTQSTASTIRSRSSAMNTPYETSSASIGSDSSNSMNPQKINNRGHHKNVNASLILGMERTLFAALNNAWLLAIGGIGLMSVGSGDERATLGGIIVLVGGIFCSFMAFGMHFWRVLHLRDGRSFQYSHTVIWTMIIAILTVATLLLELYFGIMYPYLQREKAVTVVDQMD